MSWEVSGTKPSHNHKLSTFRQIAILFTATTRPPLQYTDLAYKSVLPFSGTQSCDAREAKYKISIEQRFGNALAPPGGIAVILECEQNVDASL